MYSKNIFKKNKYYKFFERIQGKTVFITGDSAGIGEATVVIFAKYGSNHILTARRESLLDKLEQEIISQYPTIKIHIAKLYVSDYEAVKESYRYHPEWAAQIDILINNAGLTLDALPPISIPEASIDTTKNTNVKV
ncbi:putative oxidoreductase [Smittium culicis]|uniref:Putative oxidoreductase n=1 Tax=Smittium culicis TaxID=133412 RepID=A0A1R1XC90_9FUNG|nr:putative oxidoreductase [Smittium culicis]